MKKRFLFLVLLLALVVCAVIYAKQYPLQMLIIHARDGKPMAHFVLYNLRGSSKDVAFVENETGLNFLFGDPKHDGMKELKFFLKKGCNINTVSKIDDLSLGHVAILYNSPEMLTFLLENGYDTNTREKKRNLTVCEFLHFITTQNPDMDRDDLYEILPDCNKSLIEIEK